MNYIVTYKEKTYPVQAENGNQALLRFIKEHSIHGTDTTLVQVWRDGHLIPKENNE